MTFRLSDDLRSGLERVQARDGVPFSEQLRRALQQWLIDKHATRAGGTK